MKDNLKNNREGFKIHPTTTLCIAAIGCSIAGHALRSKGIYDGTIPVTYLLSGSSISVSAIRVWYYNQITFGMIDFDKVPRVFRNEKIKVLLSAVASFSHIVLSFSELINR